ncbi:uncharacterized protein TRUGW13939_05853 [Talaromyces rugulosus]|uniref:Uncharacterized protein n=1 Tax=Talaromyces rugulosus TaxID=121627 RepID=A0A7H8QY68_TALRU|nr:uncharacterized protein TRUGW13939_05853 [Talaromyces rugulosus]QKX58726.1 hypothetical protein TRUGW13939_05853 [Talaromyces rugulosus]
MIVDISPRNTRLQVYAAWVDTWLDTNVDQNRTQIAKLLSVGEIAILFQDANIDQLLHPDLLPNVIISFRQRFNNGEISLGGVLSPSCTETNLMSEKYDPRVDCTCDGISPMSFIKDADLTKARNCEAIKKMLLAQNDVTQRPKEWNGHGLFTVKKLEYAVKELVFCNLDIQPSPTICSGADIATAVPPIKAPDRRPNPQCDNSSEAYEALYPTLEKVKLYAGNDVLIGDYCEAVTEETLSLLQKNGAAAVAFLKVCNLAEIVSDWQIDILVAAHIQFRVMGYYRNHAVPKLPEGLYGSRVTDLISHRHIDIANIVGVVAASLATGQQINEAEYMKLSYGTTLINDLVDLRSDTMRKQRENPVLRGVRGSACQYLNEKILDCLIFTRELIESKQLLAMVTMAFCKWAVMASHHKLYELIQGTRENTEITKCAYVGLEEQYDKLLTALQPYGSLGADGPQWKLKRMELDNLYSINRRLPKTHLAWLADMVRLLLKPSNFRRIVDVVHYPWTGDIGQVEYCP